MRRADGNTDWEELALLYFGRCTQPHLGTLQNFARISVLGVILHSGLIERPHQIGSNLSIELEAIETKTHNSADNPLAGISCKKTLQLASFTPSSIVTMIMFLCSS